MTIQDDKYYDTMEANRREEIRTLNREILSEVKELGYTADILRSRELFDKMYDKKKDHNGHIVSHIKFKGNTYACLIEFKRVYIFSERGGTPLAVFCVDKDGFYPSTP